MHARTPCQSLYGTIQRGQIRCDVTSDFNMLLRNLPCLDYTRVIHQNKLFRSDSKISQTLFLERVAPLKNMSPATLMDKSLGTFRIFQGFCIIAYPRSRRESHPVDCLIPVTLNVCDSRSEPVLYVVTPPMYHAIGRKSAKSGLILPTEYLRNHCETLTLHLRCSC